MKIKKGFTIGEILIVLMVIGIMTAILAPVAMQAMPDGQIIKFKKANINLSKIVKMIYADNNDALYNKSNVDSTSYFCEAFANSISAKRQTCSTPAINKSSSNYILKCNRTTSTTTFEEELDQRCAAVTVAQATNLIVDVTGAIYYEEKPQTPFSSTAISMSDGIECAYKVFCIDIDEIGKDEPPFGYGIRNDGKVAPGKRAQEWVAKIVQKR